MERLTWILLLLFLLGEAPAFARDFWNIDCGGNNTFVNANKLTFEGDAPYIRTGISAQAPDTAGNGFPPEILTLRAFPSEPWKKSCYRIPVEAGTKVLVRTSFYYGNYDGLNLPPKFEVHFDTGAACSVMSLNLTSRASCETVYLTTKKQGTDICFVRTKPDQSPIVSTIEVRRLSLNMYGLVDFSNKMIFRRRRLAFGADRDIAYPDDAYNRNWTVYNQGVVVGGVNEPLFVKGENATAVDTTETNNSPPALLFEAAAVAPMVSNQSAANLTIPASWLPIVATDIYVAMYFTEPVASSPGKRMFDVYKDDVLISNASDPIQPRYGFAKEFSITLPAVSNGTAFAFYLLPAKGSTLPPAISGLEVLSIYDRKNATDSKDVDALSTLQSSYTVFGNWTGDPCLPTGFNWEWVGCKYPDLSPPRINKLLLSGYQLSGAIPDFSSLDALEVIDLSNNSFTGRVPGFIASLPNLQTLDLSFNDFDGMPTSLLDEKRITLITRGNPKLSVPSTPSPGPSGTTTSAATNTYKKRCSSKLALFILIFATAATV